MTDTSISTAATSSHITTATFSVKRQKIPFAAKLERCCVFKHRLMHKMKFPQSISIYSKNLELIFSKILKDFSLIFQISSNGSIKAT